MKENVSNDKLTTPILFPFEPEQFWQLMRSVIRKEVQSIDKQKSVIAFFEPPGLPKEKIDQLEGSKLTNDKIQKQIFYYGNLIKNFPNHLSVHAGGMLISDEPVHHYTATELPPKVFYTSQIDMFVAEKINLFKLDILSQRGLGHIFVLLGSPLLALWVSRDPGMQHYQELA